MKNNQVLQWTIFSLRWVHWLRISGLLILLATPFILIFAFPRLVYSDAMISVDGGLGNFEVKNKGDRYRSVSKNSRRHILLGIDLEKEEYPFRVSFRWGFFDTDEKSEKWTIDPIHENRLNIHGETFDLTGSYTLYNFASGKDTIRVRPFIGGGLGYKRFKFERKGLNKNILTPPDPDQYFLGNQGIMAIGATPLMGFFMELPKLKVECNLNLGWTLLAVKSNTDYHYFSGSGDVMHHLINHTSGTSLVTGIKVVKSWESFSVALGYIWEKTRINDKLLVKVKKVKLPDESTYTKYFYFPFPEFEIIQTFGQISLNYLF